LALVAALSRWSECLSQDQALHHLPPTLRDRSGRHRGYQAARPRVGHRGTSAGAARRPAPRRPFADHAGRVSAGAPPAAESEAPAVD